MITYTGLPRHALVSDHKSQLGLSLGMHIKDDCAASERNQDTLSISFCKWKSRGIAPTIGIDDGCGSCASLSLSAVASASSFIFQ